jgi:hypothetical protein
MCYMLTDINSYIFKIFYILVLIELLFYFSADEDDD